MNNIFKQTDIKNPLEEILKEGSKRMLQVAVENEVQEYIEAFQELKVIK